MRIRTKIAGMGVALVMFTAVSIVSISVFQKSLVEQRLEEKVQNLARNEASQVARDVFLMSKAMQESLDETMAYNLKVAEYVLERAGPVAFAGQQAAWVARNQYTGDEQRINLPKMTVGGEWLKQNRSLAVETLIVDQVKQLVGGTCTIFQRMSESGDMLRVATNVETDDGERAIGTYIPHWNPDGTENQVIAKVLRGETFVGQAYVVNAWYVTAYEPIWNADKSRVEGVLYVGKKQENLQSLKQSIRDITLGRSGYAFVVGGSGDLRGHYIVTKNRLREGEDLWNSPDPESRENARLVVNSGLALRGQNDKGEIPVTIVSYKWKNPDDPHPRHKQVALTYFEPWDWVIGASFYEDDLTQIQLGITEVMNDMIEWIALVAFCIALIAVVVGLLVAQGISKPLVTAVQVFNELGKGRLDVALSGSRQDEIGQLSRAFNKMMVDLKAVTTSRDELNAEIAERLAAEHRLRENEARLDHLAHHDPLTGLPNRLLLRDRLAMAMKNADRNGSRVALLFLDLDRFKNINDTLGHVIGDELLSAVSRRLARSLRQADTMARFGGDEFMMVLANLNSELAAQTVARKLLDEVATFSQVHGHELFVTASLGIAIYPDNATDIDGLMRAADIAMYQAKAKGRNQYEFYSPHMNTRAMELLVLENELRKALDEQHLELFYQPLVDLCDGRMVGAEALVRWRHPLRGIVPPGDFISLAEDTGLIIPIGKWIFGEACRQARRWQDKGYEEMKLSVNLSAKQFQHQELLSDIEEQLQLHAVDGRLISVELTESALMNNAEKAVETMEALNKLGLEIAIDDFGTGYSSLAYLKRFPIQKLKIDKTFVCDLANNHSDAAIIQATLALAKSLSLDVVAEGVETQDQLRLLREYGCRIGQGFLFGRPVPADEFERSHLANHTRFAVVRCT